MSATRFPHSSTYPQTFKKTQIENVEVSTIIYFGGTGKRVVETMIFLDPGPTHGLTDFESENSPEGHEAEQHQRWVSKVSEAVYGA
jgi:hypothetical protein